MLATVSRQATVKKNLLYVSREHFFAKSLTFAFDGGSVGVVDEIGVD